MILLKTICINLDGMNLKKGIKRVKLWLNDKLKGDIEDIDESLI